MTSPTAADADDGLGAVLAGRRPPGVHRRDRAPSGDRVCGAGWRLVELDGPTPDLPAVHGALAAALQLPAHYGRNLDALHDVLRGLDRPTVLVWPGWGGLAGAHPVAFRRLVRVLAAGGGQHGSPLEVVLTGPAPRTGEPADVERLR